MYSTILLKGPGNGIVWEGMFRYFPFRITCSTKEQHEMIVNYLAKRGIIYEIQKLTKEGTEGTPTNVQVTITDTIAVKDQKPVTRKRKGGRRRVT